MNMPIEKMALSRRAFLKGRPLQKQIDSKISNQPILPWAKVSQILESCSRCDLCHSACPEKIIHAGEGGFPTVDFSAGECSFCGQCADVCPEAVFDAAPHIADTAWDLKATIKSDCLAEKGVQCQACQDHCEPRAIRFDFQQKSIPVPMIVLDKCTGCGACVSICPTNSISVIPPETPPAERG